jgi:hypothetical protein
MEVSRALYALPSAPAGVLHTKPAVAAAESAQSRSSTVRARRRTCAPYRAGLAVGWAAPYQTRSGGVCSNRS